MKALRLTVLAVLLCGEAAAQQPARPALHRFGDVGAGRWSGFSASPTGRFVLFADANGRAHAFDRSTEEARPLGWNGEQVAWSPDGQQVAFIDNNRLWLAHIDSVQLMPRGAARALSQRSAEAPAFSPDGARITFVSRQGDGYVMVTVDTAGRNEEVVASGRSYPEPPYWSAGNYRVRAADDGGYRLANPDGLAIAALDLPLDLRLVGWLESGSTILGLHERVYTNLRVTDSTGALTLARAQRSFDGPPAWSPDGQLIALTTMIGRRRELIVMRAEGGPREQLLLDAEPAEAAPVWSADGRYIAILTKNQGIAVVERSTQASVAFRSRFGAVRSVEWAGPAALRYVAAAGDSLMVVRHELGGLDEVVGRTAEALPSPGAAAAAAPAALARAGEVRGAVVSRTGRIAYLSVDREGIELWAVDVRRILARQ